MAKLVYPSEEYDEIEPDPHCMNIGGTVQRIEGTTVTIMHVDDKAYEVDYSEFPEELQELKVGGFACALAKYDSEKKIWRVEYDKSGDDIFLCDTPEVQRRLAAALSRALLIGSRSIEEAEERGEI